MAPQNVEPWQFRLLTLADLASLVELERLCFTTPWSEESYRQELTANPIARYFGLFHQDHLVAYAGYWLILEEGHIANVGVHPDFRNQGVGEYLLRQVMAVCLGEGGRWMTLEVRPSNFGARRLYQKLGFESLGQRPRYYEDGEGALILWVDLFSCGAAAASPSTEGEKG